MIKHKLLFLVIILLIFNNSFSQKYHGIKYNIDRSEVCQNMTSIFLNKPKEVKFSVKRDGNKLFFNVNNEEWFNTLLKIPNHALAIDIVNKSGMNVD